MTSRSTADSLYGKSRPKLIPSTSNPPSSSTVAFTTHLASLISKETDPSTTTRGRPRPSKTSKSDIFIKHNKGAEKRAAKDELETDLRQVHQRTADVGTVDAATLHRSKRRMEEKVRVYEDLKSGLYLAAESDDDDDDDEIGPRAKQEDYLARLRRKEREGLVDFDRKWADEERAKRRASTSDEDENEPEDEEEEDDDDNASIISYEDELGRSRRGTRKQAAHTARLKQRQKWENEHGPGADNHPTWKPARPENLIYGPAIQSEAFNPAAPVAEQMSYLASRRDRSPTPEQMHYDADAEVRTRGTGFYAFSKDEETRKKQMEELMNARVETQRERKARQTRRAERERLKDERRKKIEELRVRRRAETFLAGLGDIQSVHAG